MAADGLTLNLSVPFANEREAEIAYQVLRVDKEPPRSQVSKSLVLENKTLIVSFLAPTAQQLRTGINGFFEHLILVCDTLVSFGPPVSSQYSYYE